MEALDERGLRLDAGSVATGRVHEPSPVLEAMGSPGMVGFRVGLGRTSTDESVDALLRELPPLARRLQRVAPSAFDRDAPPG
jgi:cysteine sulfinate desulfinase/cysteine desulfurase-like protein